jgi:hypothetical protein
MLLTILLLSLSCGLATAVFFIKRDLKATEKKAHQFFLNYNALISEMDMLQSENDDLIEVVQSYREDEFNSLHRAPCESEAFRAGYTLDAEGNLVLAELDALKFEAMSSTTNGCCEVYDDCGDACEY